MFIVCFDICDEKRLRRVSREMGNFGVRVQKSVFECHLDESEYKELQSRLAKLIKETEDTVRYYPVCSKDQGAILINGPGGVTVDVDYKVI